MHPLKLQKQAKRFLQSEKVSLKNLTVTTLRHCERSAAVSCVLQNSFVS